ncbi:MAG TPA: Rrf2 family transcriptional regulator [Synergistales bacterium]|nr:Rrf2 family transcriptional regulator [Synergistales bacterium]HRV71674.1 Rrf2 family transcriptional regulator [Thermovirgaceae bacterium]
MKNIIQISEAASLALHGMGLLAIKGGRLSVREMALVTGSSEAHLSKVFQRLSREGLVTSVRGPGGGFILARPAAEITLLDIYSAIEGEPKLEPCLLGKVKCPFGKCIFGEMIPEITGRFIDHLSRTTLAEMANPSPGK